MNRDTLPLFYYPSMWIYVDDDKNLLKSMAYVLNEFNFVKLFDAPTKCLEYLSNYTPPSLNFSFLKSVTDDENHGVLHHTPIDFDVTALSKIADKQSRHEEITAMIIDYGMSEMDGLLLAKKSEHLPANKILLTGKDRENQAIKGFNGNLIQRFVRKFEEGMEETLITHLKSLTLQYFQNLTSSLLTHLETENKLPLTDPIFVKFFIDYCGKNDISEYYLIDKQGSFLLINKKGKKSCLVVQSEKGLDTWLSTYVIDAEIPQNDLAVIKSKKKIPFFGVGIEPWQIDTNLLPNYFYPANKLDGREKYFWTIINI